MSWTSPFRFGETMPVTRKIAPNEAERKSLAKELTLVALDSLEAQVSVEPWFDGVQITGRWSADIAQTCGVTLERLDTPLAGDFLVRVVPEDSLHAPSEDDEIDLDPEADDPPDLAEGNSVDLAHYVIEHLALEIDPFPRKPGAEFVAPEAPPESSPFDALRKLKGEG